MGSGKYFLAKIMLIVVDANDEKVTILLCYSYEIPLRIPVFILRESMVLSETARELTFLADGV